MYQRYESSLGPEHCTSSECVDPSLSMPSAEKYTDWNAAYQQSLSSVIQPLTHIYRVHRCVLSPNQPSTSTNPTTFSMQHPKYLNVPPTPNLDRPNPMPFSDGSTHLQSHRPYHRSPPAIYPPHHPPPTRHPPLYTSLPLLPKTHMKRSSHNASRKKKKPTGMYRTIPPHLRPVYIYRRTMHVTHRELCPGVRSTRTAGRSHARGRKGKARQGWRCVGFIYICSRGGISRMKCGGEWVWSIGCVG